MWVADSRPCHPWLRACAAPELGAGGQPWAYGALRESVTGRPGPKKTRALMLHQIQSYQHHHHESMIAIVVIIITNATCTGAGAATTATHPLTSLPLSGALSAQQGVSDLGLIESRGTAQPGPGLALRDAVRIRASAMR